jgi:hypothetical protein
MSRDLPRALLLGLLTRSARIEPFVDLYVLLFYYTVHLYPYISYMPSLLSISLYDCPLLSASLSLLSLNLLPDVYCTSIIVSDIIMLVHF